MPTSSTERMAALRATRKAQGYRETTIWLSSAAEAIIAEALAGERFKDRSEAVEFALRKAFKTNRNGQMTT